MSPKSLTQCHFNVLDRQRSQLITSNCFDSSNLKATSLVWKKTQSQQIVTYTISHHCAMSLFREITIMLHVTIIDVEQIWVHEQLQFVQQFVSTLQFNSISLCYLFMNLPLTGHLPNERSQQTQEVVTTRAVMMIRKWTCVTTNLPLGFRAVVVFDSFICPIYLPGSTPGQTDRGCCLQPTRALLDLHTDHIITTCTQQRWSNHTHM